MRGDTDFLLTLYLKIFTASALIPVALMYIGIASRFTPQERWRVAQKGTAVAACILLCVVICGASVLRWMGIDMDTFRIAGGLLLGKIGWDMLYSKTEKSASSVSGNDLVVTPLAFPLIAGPGGISAILIGQSEAVNGVQNAYVYIAVIFILMSFYIAFYIACFLSNYMKPIFIQICTKLFGILILATALKSIAIGTLELLKEV